VKAVDIVGVLRAHYRPPEWAFFEEIRAGTGYGYKPNTDMEKRLDAWVFHLWPSGGYQPTGFEIKITRSDFLRELKKKGKVERYMALCQFFYYVTPANLVLSREIPDEAGLIWMYPKGRMRVMKKPPYRDIPIPEWDFFAAICRRVSNAGWHSRPES